MPLFIFSHRMPTGARTDSGEERIKLTQTELEWLGLWLSSRIKAAPIVKTKL
jgi:hypothetical protein